MPKTGNTGEFQKKKEGKARGEIRMKDLVHCREYDIS
jgi:hypothetical protein